MPDAPNVPEAPRLAVVRCRVCDVTVELSAPPVVSAAEVVAFVEAHEHDDGDKIELLIRSG